MAANVPAPAALPEAQRGPAERLLGLVLTASAHLWHNRPGVDVGGKWQAARPDKSGARPIGTRVNPGIFAPAAVELYRQLLEIYQLNPLLMAHFASYALVETDWRDLKIACAALMLVQPQAGQPVLDNGKVDFFENDYRSIGEAMILYYQKGSTRMLAPKGILRIAELLALPEIAALNRDAGFGDPASKRSPMGRWRRAAEQWLALRERNLPLLEGLVKAGYRETIKRLARKVGYKPESQRFFEILGWPQKQTEAGHRSVGLGQLDIRKSTRFDGMTEGDICARIVFERLSYKDAVGRLPAGMGLTPAIMVALLPSLSDRDLRMMTPTLETLGLLEDDEVKARWERAVASATDQRALNIAENVRNRETREKLETAADKAVQAAVSEVTRDEDLDVMFLIDKSGSMEGTIDAAKDAISRILAGFPSERLHIAAFDTSGYVLKPKSPTRNAVKHMLKDVCAGGGTVYGAGAAALRSAGFRMRPGAKLILICAGDEAGEDGGMFARALTDLELRPSAIALIVSVSKKYGRGTTVRTAANTLGVPFSEIDASTFDDPYQVPRVMRALLDAPVMAGGVAVAPSAWVEKVMKTPLLQKPVI